MAVTHAVKFYMQGKDYEPLILDTSFITCSLKRLLEHPDKDMLQRLAALQVRYARYRISPAMAQGQEFPVDTAFLSLIRGQSVTALAWQLSENTLREFYYVSLSSLFTNDEHLRRLGTEWDRLCQDAEEVAAVSEMNEVLGLLSQVWSINSDSIHDFSTNVIGALSPAKLFLSFCGSVWYVLGQVAAQQASCPFR